MAVTSLSGHVAAHILSSLNAGVELKQQGEADDDPTNDLQPDKVNLFSWSCSSAVLRSAV